MSGLAPFAHLYSMKLKFCESLSSSSSEEEIKRPEEFDEQQAKYKQTQKQIWDLALMLVTGQYI